MRSAARGPRSPYQQGRPAASASVMLSTHSCGGYEKTGRDRSGRSKDVSHFQRTFGRLATIAPAMAMEHYQAVIFVSNATVPRGCIGLLSCRDCHLFATARSIIMHA